jgi:type VI secretion system protein ImpF
VARESAQNVTLRLSVLDRLLDHEPGNDGEAPIPPHVALSRAIEGVRRDLQLLLNTRLTWIDERVLSLDEVSRSLATYGVPDFSHENLGNSGSRDRLQRTLEAAISLFEPRLTRVVVTPEPMQEHQRDIRFRIDALLRVDPVPEPVTFDTVMRTDGLTQVVAT